MKKKLNEEHLDKEFLLYKNKVMQLNKLNCKTILLYLEKITNNEKNIEYYKTKIIEANLYIVVHIVDKYYSDYKDKMELVQLGNLILLESIEKYKINFKTPFRSYLNCCIVRGFNAKFKEINILESVYSLEDNKENIIYKSYSEDDYFFQELSKYMIYVIDVSSLSERYKSIAKSLFDLNNEDVSLLENLSSKHKVSKQMIYKIKRQIEKALLNEKKILELKDYINEIQTIKDKQNILLRK